jgi:hypothetical protein
MFSGVRGSGRAAAVAGLFLGVVCVAGASLAQVQPGYPPQYPPPAYPAQQYPAQQYPAQPYPYPAQQPYPAQPYPAQPYPAQPYQQPYQQPYPGQGQTQTWTVTLGVCSDWVGTWNMQHVGPGHWLGTSVISVRSNQCTRTPIGTRLIANVDFTTFVNRTWRATDTNTANGSHCQYSGSVNSQTSASGAYTCGVSGQQSHIIITSPVAFYN